MCSSQEGPISSCRGEDKGQDTDRPIQPEKIPSSARRAVPPKHTHLGYELEFEARHVGGEKLRQGDVGVGALDDQQEAEVGVHDAEEQVLAQLLAQQSVARQGSSKEETRREQRERERESERERERERESEREREREAAVVFVNTHTTHTHHTHKRYQRKRAQRMSEAAEIRHEDHLLVVLRIDRFLIKNRVRTCRHSLHRHQIQCHTLT